MAVTLTPMTINDYEKFYQMSLDSQVSDLMKDGSSREEALRDTEAELSEMLPDGKDTRDNLLMMIRKEDDLTAVGYIWTLHEFTDGIRQSFLCDLMVYEDHRRRGYAGEALELMARNAHALGCMESVLYVDKDNVNAVGLYGKCGYKAFRDAGDGMYMKKVLTEG